MATYTEIYSLFAEDALKNRVDVAVIIAAMALLAGTPTTAETEWSAAVFDRPRSEGLKAFRAVLALNKDASVAQIQGVSDTALQTAVDSVVEALVVAHSAA